MPLINLKSDLTWQGDRSKAPNRVPNDGVLYQRSDFQQDANTGDVSTSVTGFAKYAKIYTSPLRNITSNSTFSLSNSKYNFGVATRITQGGEGYPFPSFNGTIYQWRNADGKEAAHTGFNSKATYGVLSGDGKGDTGTRTGYLAATYTTNSPIKAMYRKYKLRDAAYNFDYIRQPFVLSGIQDPDVLNPERSGVDSRYSLDIPRGGITTYASRAADDLGRIGKFLASGKGLLFLTKQVGLQLMNPNVQDETGRVPANPFRSVTKQFTPLKLLANVLGGSLGLRTSRHGIIPFSDIGGYETIVKGQSFSNNRLYRLREELIESNITRLGDESRVASAFSNIQAKLGFKGTPIQTLSGITGPGSVFGAGLTTIRVAERTNLNNIVKYQSKQRYKISSQYAQGLNKTVNEKSTAAEDEITKKLVGKSIQTYIDDNAQNLKKSLETNAKKAVSDPTTFPSIQNPVQRSNAAVPKLNDYATVAYGNIPKRIRHNYVGKPNNFLVDNIFNEPDGKKNLQNLISGPVLPETYNGETNKWENNPDYLDYETKNVVQRFGYLNYGSKNTKANGGDGDSSDYKKISGDDGDIILFRIGTTRFRAYIDSISDAISPTIDTEQPLGSPIFAARYRSVERNVSVAFKVAVLAKQDLSLIYGKLRDLQNYAFYKTSTDTFALQTITVRIGDLYNFEGYVESVSYDWDSDMPWDITPTKQVPLYCNVSVDFKYICPKPGFNIN